MSQEDQTMNTVAVENLPVKRKRGRPRKAENLSRRDRASALAVPDVVKRNRHRRANLRAASDDPMVGQVVTGVLDGSFDAGYLLTVRIGDSSKVLKGIVFEPRLSVPVSGTNDVAPQVQMLKRNDISLRRTAPVYYQSNQGEEKSKSPAEILPMNGVSVPTKSPSQTEHASQVATQEIPSQMHTSIYHSSKEAENGVNHASQGVSAALPQVETRIENETQATETRLPPVIGTSQPLTTQLMPEGPNLSQIWKENPTTLNSNTQLGIGIKFPTETPIVNETSRLNETPNNVMRVTDKDVESQPKMKESVHILDIGRSVSEQSGFPKATSDLHLSYSNALSENEDLVSGDGVYPMQFQSDLFGDTGAME